MAAQKVEFTPRLLRQVAVTCSFQAYLQVTATCLRSMQTVYQNWASVSPLCQYSQRYQQKVMSLIPFLPCHHSITNFEINAFLNQDSYRPQVCVRFSFNFRHWLILFHQPSAISQSLGL